MKLISFLLAILVHIVLIAVYLIFVQSNSIHKEIKKVYTVDILDIKHQAKKELLKGKKDKKPVFHTKKKKPKKIKPKPKPKPKIKPKPKPKKTAKIKPKKIVKKTITTKNKKKIEELKRELVEQKKRLLRQKLIKEKEKQKEQKIQERLKKRINQLKEKVTKQKNKQDTNNKKNNGNADKMAYEYQTLINSIIHQNWGVEKSLIKTKHFSTTVDIKLDFRGNLIYIQILKSSGSVYFDGTVINAIKISEPFPAPPKDIVENGIVEFIITFNSEEKE